VRLVRVVAGVPSRYGNGWPMATPGPTATSSSPAVSAAASCRSASGVPPEIVLVTARWVSSRRSVDYGTRPRLRVKQILRKTIAFQRRSEAARDCTNSRRRDPRRPPHHADPRLLRGYRFSGIVYHANYLRFMERGRTNHLRLLGAEQHALFAEAQAETPGFAFVVRSMQIDFLRPARMDDVLDVVRGRLR